MRLMGWITFINASVGIALGGLLYTIWPEHYFTWYPSIPVFYWLTAVAMTYFLDRVKKKNGDVTVTTFMLVRFCKFTLAIVFLWLYAVLVNERLKAFGLTLMLFYFMSIYCVAPIERMNKGLGNYLTFRAPFTVKGDLKDEVLELKEKIDLLIKQAKTPKA